MVANSRVAMDRAVAHAAGVTQDGRGAVADRTDSARVGEGDRGNDPCSARNSLRSTGATCLCVTTRDRYRTSRVESRDQTRPAWPLRANSSQTKTRKNCGHWSSCFKPSCCCRCISFVGVVVVQTHCGSHQAAARSAILVDCFTGTTQAVALSRRSSAQQFERHDQGLHCR